MRTLAAVVVLVSACLLASGCGSSAQPGGAPDETSGAPVELLADTTGDAPFAIESVSVRVAESFPVQLFLDVTGTAPTPCHRIAYTVGTSPGKVTVLVTSVTSEDVCVQVLQSHGFAIPLGAAQLPITVDVNDGAFVETVSP